MLGRYFNHLWEVPDSHCGYTVNFSTLTPSSWLEGSTYPLLKRLEMLCPLPQPPFSQDMGLWPICGPCDLSEVRWKLLRKICFPFMWNKHWKQPKCLPKDKWIKMWYIHVMEYYSALKKKEILSYATTWMNFKDIMLSEISQSQKDKYCVIALIWGS